jgi:hypothetical protein
MLGSDGFFHAGQGGFDRERDEDLAVPGGRLRVVLRDDGIVPEAIEIEPIGSGELGAGVFGMDAVGVDILGPAGEEWAGSGGPSGGGGEEGTGGAEEGEEGEHQEHEAGVGQADWRSEERWGGQS